MLSEVNPGSEGGGRLWDHLFLGGGGALEGGSIAIRE